MKIVAIAASLISFLFAIVCGVAGLWTKDKNCPCREDWCCRSVSAAAAGAAELCEPGLCYCEHLLDEALEPKCASPDSEVQDFFKFGFRASLAVFCVSTFLVLLHYCMRGFAKRPKNGDM